MKPSFEYAPGVLKAQRSFLDPAVEALSRFRKAPSPEQYRLRKILYQPGELLLIPTHPTFGGAGDTCAVAVLLSCNFLGNIQLGLTTQFTLNDRLPIEPRADDVLEAWSSGDSMLISETFRSAGRVADFDISNWPIPIDAPPPGESGLWTSRLAPRRLVPVRAPFVLNDDLRPINLFDAGTHDVPIVRASELLQGRPFEVWPVPGGPPGCPGRPFFVPQDW